MSISLLIAVSFMYFETSHTCDYSIKICQFLFSNDDAMSFTYGKDDISQSITILPQRS